MAKKSKEKKEQLAEIDEALVTKPETFYAVEDPWGRVRTGCLLHDLQAGGQKGFLGYPLGWIVNFVGGTSSGKTFVAHELIGHEYNKNKKLNHKYIPTEYGDSFDTKKLYGFDSGMDWDEVPKTVQEFDAYLTNHLKKVKSKVKDQPPTILFLDSLDGCRSNQTVNMSKDREKLYVKEVAAAEKAKEKGQADYDKDIKDKGSYNMEKANFLSQHFFPNAACELRHKNALLGIISQVRDNTDMFSFETERRNGGRAMDFYCHTVQWLYSQCKIYGSGADKDAGRSCGGIMKVKNKKSKTPRPGRIIYILFYYNFGIDDVGTSLIYLFNLLTDGGNLTKQDYDIPWDGEKRKFLELRDYLYLPENRAERNLLDDLVTEKWEKAEDNSLRLTPGAGSLKKY